MMLSDKLKALGLKVGAQDLPKPKPRLSDALEQVLKGRPWETHQGETFLVERFYPSDYRQGRANLLTSAPLHALAEWAGERQICDYSPQSFAYIDTETTGLSGGAGTCAFLIGVGRFDGDTFHLAQFFMRDYPEEPAQLAALEEFLAPCSAIVSFNGKAFDIPILNTRFTLQGWRSPFNGQAHVDLLHLARRLWRDRLPSRTLGNLEVQILGAQRSEEDIPGWMVPDRYYQYLLTGDPEPLKGVFYHNAMDVVSLAALFYHMAGLLSDPFSAGIEHGEDIVAMARLFEDMGQLEAAERLYLFGLDHDLPKPILLNALQRLAAIHKRREELEAAVALWQQAARHELLEAHVELAKCYEHRLKDIPQAMEWTQAAIQLVCSASYPPYLRRQLLPDLEHRLERLKRKLGSG